MERGLDPMNEARRLAEYSIQAIHSPDYRISIALSSIAITTFAVLATSLLTSTEPAESTPTQVCTCVMSGSNLQFLTGPHHQDFCSLYEKKARDE